MNQPQFVIEEVSDSVQVARFRAQDQRHRRNSDWLQAHWQDLIPQARGKFIAIAGEQAHIAETPEQAWLWARSTHPDDNGAFVQYVRATTGPRIYGHRG